MFKRILVPLDGSLRAESAIPVAARIARAAHGSITLLRVVTAPLDYAWYSMESPFIVQDAVEVDLKNASAYLQVVARSQALAGIDVRTEVVSGSPALTIFPVAQSEETDLIVMCSHGETGFKRWMLGSVAQKIARQSCIPVLVLREGGTALPLESTRPMRVMVPLDGSSLAEAALEPAAQLCAALSAPQQGELCLTRVLRVPEIEKAGAHDIVTETSTRIQNEAKAYLEGVQHRFTTGDMRDYNLQVKTLLAIDTDAAEMLIEIAEDGDFLEEGEDARGCDLIVMATHGRSGPQRWVMGSVSERILGATRLPLLIVRPEKAGPQHVEQKEPVGAGVIK